MRSEAYLDGLHPVLLGPRGSKIDRVQRVSFGPNLLPGTSVTDQLHYPIRPSLVQKTGQPEPHAQYHRLVLGQSEQYPPMCFLVTLDKDAGNIASPREMLWSGLQLSPSSSQPMCDLEQS